MILAKRPFQLTCCSSYSTHSQISSWENSRGKFQPPKFIALTKNAGVCFQAKFNVCSLKPNHRQWPGFSWQVFLPLHQTWHTGRHCSLLEGAAAKARAPWVSHALLHIWFLPQTPLLTPPKQGLWLRYFSPWTWYLSTPAPVSFSLPSPGPRVHKDSGAFCSGLQGDMTLPRVHWVHLILAQSSPLGWGQ